MKSPTSAERRSRIRWFPSAARLIVGCTLIVGCDVFGPGDGEPASVEIVPAEISLAPGETIDLTYVVRDRRGRVLEGVAVSWNWSDAGVAGLDHTGHLVARAPGLVRITADAYGVQGRAYAAVGTIRFDNVRDLVIAHYRKKGMELTHPAIVLDTLVRDTNLPKVPTRFIATIMGDAWRWGMELWPDGRTLAFAETPLVRPIGNHRVAVVVVDHPYTNFTQLLDGYWKAAVDSVNADHRNWAKSAGFGNALLSFDVTTLVAPVGAFEQLNGWAEKAYLDSLGVEYDILAVINFDPTSKWGGSYIMGGDLPWIYIGCFCSANWRDEVKQFTTTEVHGIAQLLFHHEMGHGMGWHHSWGGGPAGTRLITNPALLGLTDLTGDGFIELLSPNPYGNPGRIR